MGIINRQKGLNCIEKFKRIKSRLTHYASNMKIYKMEPIFINFAPTLKGDC